MSGKTSDKPIVLHLIVVGFHHKKGCLVEYCYPEIDPKIGFHFNTNNPQKCGNNSNISKHSTTDGNDCQRSGRSGQSSDGNDSQRSGQLSDESDCPKSGRSGESSDAIVLPKEWKTLPSLALPDGAHNHERDAIYFHLPALEDHNQTIYGISCYRQINANKLKAKTSDVTRGTVQKSVVVLSTLPLYGLIEAKLEMITHAYFKELDFSKVSLLEETYHNLNGQLNVQLMKSSELFVGLTPRQLVIDFQHKILLLFKLLLLERKVLFYKSPVKQLCVSILSLCSLMPGLLEKGLTNCSVSVHPKSNRQLSTDIELSPNEEFLVLNSINNTSAVNKRTNNTTESTSSLDNNCLDVKNSETNYKKNIVTNTDSDDDLLKEIDEVLSEKSSNSSSHKSSPVKEREVNSQSIFYDNLEPKPERLDRIDDNVSQRSETPPILKLNNDECGLPLQIFSCGSYLQPYLSLTYLDVLTDVRVRSCLVGATNFLFKQKKDIFDVIVDLDEGKVDIADAELRKQLTLTTEDLRFADFLVKNVLIDCDINGQNGDIFTDGTGWEGSDEWIRYHFKVYLLHMLRSSEMDESSKDYMSFNSQFMTAWRSSHNYKIWSSVSHPMVFEVTAGHPFNGQLSVSDMKLKLSQIFNSKTEQNKKLNQTYSRTTRAMGGAVTTAKSAISSAVTSFWSSWSTAKTTDKALEPPKGKEAETQL